MHAHMCVGMSVCYTGVAMQDMSFREPSLASNPFRIVRAAISNRRSPEFPEL